MSIVYSQEYLQQLATAQRTQQTSAAFLEINDIAINYNTEYEAIEAMSQMTSPYGEAWYYDPVRNAAGDVIGMDYVQVPTSVENPPAVINSNVTNPVFTKNGGRIRINGSGGGTPPNKFSKGAKLLSTELPAGSTVAGRLGWLAAATALGTKLGKTISSVIYDLGGGWQYNPENWKSLVDANSPLDDLDKAALRILFGLDENTGTVTPYLNSDALGAMFLTMLQSGAYDIESIEATYTGSGDVQGVPQPLPLIAAGTHFIMQDGTYYSEIYSTAEYVTLIIDSSGPTFYYYSREPFVVYSRGGPNEEYVPFSSSGPYTTPEGVTFYQRTNTYGPNYSSSVSIFPHTDVQFDSTKGGTVIYDGTIARTTGMDGVEDDTTGATYFPTPDTISGTDLDTVNRQLRDNYPQLFDGEIFEDVPQPDGTNKRITYIPVPFPNTSNPTQPITGDNHQNNPQSNPETNTPDQLDDLIDLITDILTPYMTPNPNQPTEPAPPDTGSGDTPPVVIPTGYASSLWSVYNPTQAQVDAFGGWLWSSNFIDQIKKLFNDPMQAIIGIHKVFATPATGETRTIVCGYIDSEVPSKIVTSQYTTIDCGTVNLREYFGNVFDYSPFTEVSLYLPFIGIVRLDVGDVMRASIKVKYHVDVITGACLADVIVTRDNAGGVLYQYSGSAIVTYPISSGSYASAIGGILSIAGGIAATVMTGGAAAPAVLGAAAGITHLHSDVQKSGSFTGAAGAMGGKKPYIIISRPQTGMPAKFAHLQGYPVNYYTKLGDCTGHVRVSDVQVKGVNATDTELDMIRDVLLQGVEI